LRIDFPGYGEREKLEHISGEKLVRRDESDD
jgi:hypothetical protein